MTTTQSSTANLRRIDLSRATGCNIETIRYYETIGILPSPPRTAKGYRVYDHEHVSRLGFVMRARELGFTLEEVRGLLSLVDGDGLTCGEVQRRAQAHLDDVAARIADLQSIQSVLAGTVAKCTGKDVPECAVIDALMPA